MPWFWPLLQPVWLHWLQLVLLPWLRPGLLPWLPHVLLPWLYCGQCCCLGCGLCYLGCLGYGLCGYLGCNLGCCIGCGLGCCLSCYVGCGLSCCLGHLGSIAASAATLAAAIASLAAASATACVATLVAAKAAAFATISENTSYFKPSSSSFLRCPLSHRCPIHHRHGRLHPPLWCPPPPPSSTTVAETMQRNCEASVKCLHIKGYPYNLQCNGSPVEGFPEVKDEFCAHAGGNIVEPDPSLNSESLESANEFHKKPTYPNDFDSWLTFHPDSNVQRCQLNFFEGQFYPFLVDNRFRYAPLNFFHQSYPYEYQFQDFQYFVVIDFEATCDKGRNPHPQEIIEFPSVIVSSVTGQLEACFQTYVKPTCNQLLSDFCKDLTGIQQIQVDRGVTLSEALLRHDKWLEKKGIKNTNFAVVTWSNWDCRVMLESECRYKKIRKPPYFNRWINLKVPFHELFGGVRCNLKEAVQMAGLAWQGRAHCGLDDATNTARLLAFLMHKGFKFFITDKLMCQSTDHSSTWKQPQEHLPIPPYHPHKLKDLHNPVIQLHPLCYCGVKSSKGMVRKPGPKQGSFFFGCGNWTAARGARCLYFEWASP